MTALDVRAVLGMVKSLPSPWRRKVSRHDGHITVECEWCFATAEHFAGDMHAAEHPANDCLWYLAHQPPPAEGETPLFSDKEMAIEHLKIVWLMTQKVIDKSKNTDVHNYCREIDTQAQKVMDIIHREATPASPERATPPLAQFADAIKARLTQIGFKAGGLVHQAVDDSLSALSDTPGDGGAWQPIKGAPKDGCWIMLHWPHWCAHPIVGKWFPKNSPNGHWDSVDVPSQDVTGADGPTHWQPLPDAPAGAPER